MSYILFPACVAGIGIAVVFHRRATWAELHRLRAAWPEPAQRVRMMAMIAE